MRDALKNFRFLAWPIAAVTLVTGIEWLNDDTAEAPVNAARWESSGFGPTSYSEAMEASNAHVSLGIERASKGQAQWLRQESLARAHLGRARLSHSYDDLTIAGKALSEAKRLAPTGSGPLLTDAVFAQMSHQLGRAEKSLSAMDGWAVRTDPAILAESASLKGDVAFYRGDMPLSRQHYEEAERYGSNVGASYRLAILSKSQGDFDSAIHHFANANPNPHISTPFANARAAMQIGGVELARGEYRAARKWFEAADRLFPGFWLIEAHLAQAKALEGNLAGAIAEMKSVAHRAPSPEILDALAMLLRVNGQDSESRFWAKKSAAIWEKRLAQLPEAAYGHVVEHELVFGSPAKALELARRNVAARPYGEARILLASALLSNGDVEEALEQLTIAERSGWRSASLYALRAQALDLSGTRKKADHARKAAKALNPRIFESETSLVWLSHG